MSGRNLAQSLVPPNGRRRLGDQACEQTQLLSDSAEALVFRVLPKGG